MSKHQDWWMTPLQFVIAVFITIVMTSSLIKIVFMLAPQLREASSRWMIFILILNSIIARELARHIEKKWWKK